MAEWEEWCGSIFMLAYENEVETGNLIILVVSECWKCLWGREERK